MNVEIKYLLSTVLLSIIAPLVCVVIIGGIGKFAVVIYTLIISCTSIAIMLIMFRCWMVSQEVIFLTKDTKITFKD